MDLIVAVNQKWGIGKDGKLLHHISEDMKFFKQMTLNRTVVMGRKTLESFPNGEPLKNRTNVVLTRDKNYQKDNIVVMHSVDEVLKRTQDAIVIGGGEIYKQFLPYCKIAYITKIESSEDADTFFPNLDEDEEWELKGVLGFNKEYHGLKYSFNIYIRTE